MAEMGKEVIRGGLFLNKRDTIAYLNIDTVPLVEICPTDILPT